MYNYENEPTMLDRATDLLERADKLDQAVSELQVFRSLLEDLDARTPIHLPPLELSRQQVEVIHAVRAAILRTAIALAVAILDSKGRDRASFGQIAELLKDTKLIEFFLEKRGHNNIAKAAMSKKLQEACDRYHQIYTGQPFQRVQQLRHDEIAHLLNREQPTPTSQHSDVVAIIDEIEDQVITLLKGLGMSPHFITLKEQAVEEAKLCWDTYFAGVAALH
jgi:hypothetical protein